MRHFAVYSLGLFLLLPGALAQSENTLFGDFEVHDIPLGTGAPAAFQILLLNRGLQVVGRETLHLNDQVVFTVRYAARDSRGIPV